LGGCSSSDRVHLVIAYVKEVGQLTNHLFTSYVLLQYIAGKHCLQGK
jgi:hypothetical protein